MITVFGEHEEKTLQQLLNCVAIEENALGVACADAHFGYTLCVGGGVQLFEHIIPAGVGYDIGCGNKAVLTDLKLEDISGVLPAIADEIQSRISFGMGRNNKEPVDHEVLDMIRAANVDEQRELYDLACRQLGTVGAGNHYVDLLVDESDRIWGANHFGSRGFGWKTAAGFMSVAETGKWSDKPARGENERAVAALRLDSEAGQAYLDAMQLAGDYAYAGRDLVMDKVLEILGAKSLYEVHNHHNFAWSESHFGERGWVIRKGCTPAFPGQEGFVGASMEGNAVILEGVDSDLSRAALHSTVHGAGRAMSRIKAAGKIGNVYECTDRNCNFFVTGKEYATKRSAAKADNERFTLCPDHPTGRMKKQMRRVREGLVNWPSVQQRLVEKGIVLRGGAADEAPEAYKNLNEVLSAHADTINVKHVLKPIVVVMAGVDTKDLYKD